jgi:hypothetical protein
MPGYVRVGNLRAKVPKSSKPQPGEIAVRVDRHNPVLGNQYILYDAANSEERSRVINMYNKDLIFDKFIDGPMTKEIETLANRVIAGDRIILMCWCHPYPCHAHLIVEAIEIIVKAKSV